MKPTPRTQPEHLFGLEILRFVAALFVVVYHYRVYFKTGGTRPMPFSTALWPAYVYGQYAVQVFWTLSGYIFFWKYNKAIAEHRISTFEFFILRLSRLYPLHLLTLATVLLLYWPTENGWPPYAMSWPYLISQIFFASNWFTAKYSFNGPIWSVSVEVLIYAAFFFAARTGRLNGLSMLPLIIVVSAGVYWMTLYAFPGGGGPLLNITGCSACFFLGATLAKGREAAAAHYRIMAPALSLFAVILFLFRPTYALAFAMPVAAVFLCSAGRFWRTKPMRHLSRLGDLTYGSYLLHFPIAAALRLVGARVLDSVASPLFFMLYLALVFSAAAACFSWFERPAQNAIRHRFLVIGYRGSPSPNE